MPGALNLFDDFIAVHLNQTPFIHLTVSRPSLSETYHGSCWFADLLPPKGTFLSWHRYFIHHYETRLAACGYSKPLPYWDWSLDAASGKPMSASPVFDGSDTSVGSDGTPIPHEGYQLPAPFSPPEMVTYLPPGSGGGCIAKGPFKGLQTRLGPVAMPIYGSTNFTGVPDPLNSNPRCVKRDLNTYSAKRFCSYANVTSLILGSPNVEIFQAVLQADPRYVTTPGEIGAHGGGHYIIGGDPGSDPFISPGDPAFYLHHANVDR